MSKTLTSETLLEVAYFVEQSRKDNSEIDLLLNPQKRRAELAEMMEDFYLRQGRIDVTPEMIQAGVDEYERERFSYKGLQGGWMTRKIADFYMFMFSIRDGALWVLFNAFICASLALIVSLLYEEDVFNNYSKRHNSQYSSVSDKYNSNKVYIENVMSWRTAIAEKEDLLAHSIIDQKLKNYDRLISELDESFEKLNTERNRFIKLGAPQKETLESYRIAFDEIEDSIKSQLERVNFINDKIIDIKNFVEYYFSQQSEILALEREGVPTEEIKKALISGNVTSSSALISAAKANLQKQRTATRLLENHKILVAQKSSFLDQESISRASIILDEAKIAAEKGDEPNYRRLETALQKFANQVNKALTVRIVDDPAISTGLTRSIDGASRYYVVLELVDQAGNRYERHLYNQETKRSETVKFWGQEVDEKTYLAVKKDKSDSIVDDRIVGSKKPGHYALSFDWPMKAGTITRW